MKILAVDTSGPFAGAALMEPAIIRAVAPSAAFTVMLPSCS